MRWGNRIGIRTHGIPQPVGGSGQGNAAGADRQWKDLANHDPSARTPSRGEEEDKDGDEGDLRIDSGNVVSNRHIKSIKVCFVEANSDTNDGAEELTDEHAKSTPDEKRSTTKLLNSVEGDWCWADVDESEDQGDQEGVGDGSCGLQKRRREVEDEVDTGPGGYVSNNTLRVNNQLRSPLLHHLEWSSQDGTAQVRLLDPETTSKAVDPARDETRVRDERALILFVGNDFGQLDLDIFRIFGLPTKSAERIRSIVKSSTLNEVTRRVWQEEQATSKDKTPRELYANRDTVRASVGTVLSRVDNDWS